MNQQNQGSGSPSNVPIKRKRGRPRKDDKVLNSTHQTVGAATATDCNANMVGKAVTGIVEATFKDGFLLNVNLPESGENLRGVVFLPGQVNPVTAANDVAPNVKMIERKELPMPNTQTEVHGSGSGSGSGSASGPSPVQCSKLSLGQRIQVPVSGDQVLPTEIHSDISVSLEKQFASTMIPAADLQKNEATIMSESEPEHVSGDQVLPTEIHSGISVSLENQSASTMIPAADMQKNEATIMSEPEQVPPTETHSGIIFVSLGNQSSSTMIPDLPEKETTTMSGPKHVFGEQVPPTEIHSGISVSLGNQSSSIADLPEKETTTMSGEQVAPTEIHSGISVSLGNQSPSTMIPDLPEKETTTMSEPKHVSGSGEQVPPTEIHSGISVSLGNQSPSTMILDPVADLPKNETTIMSEPELVGESGSIMSELECDKAAIKQGDDTLHELDASTQEKESSADGGDGGETRDRMLASEPIDPVPTIGNTEKEVGTEQQAVHEHKELVQDKPNTSDTQLNPIPVVSELGSMQSEDSEQTSKPPIDNFMESQEQIHLDDTKTDSDLPVCSD